MKIQDQVTAAVRPSYEELAAQLPTQEQLSIDESGTKEANGKAWRWTFVARMFTVFAVRATREATALNVFLGEAFHGIVNRGRAKMYWRPGCLQWCWAHLKRDFQAMIDSGTVQGKWLGSRLRRLTCESFEHWADYRAGEISWAALRRRMAPVRRKVEASLLRGAQSADRDVRGTCRELYGHRQWLWTFLRYQGIEPTRPTFGWCPAGERSLRHARAPRAAWSLAESLLRDAERQRQPLRRDHADGHRDPPPAGPQRLLVPHYRCPSSSRPPTRPFTAPRGVNGYEAFRRLEATPGKNDVTDHRCSKLPRSVRSAFWSPRSK